MSRPIAVAALLPLAWPALAAAQVASTASLATRLHDPATGAAAGSLWLGFSADVDRGAWGITASGQGTVGDRGRWGGFGTVRASFRRPGAVSLAATVTGTFDRPVGLVGVGEGAVRVTAAVPLGPATVRFGTFGASRFRPGEASGLLGGILGTTLDVRRLHLSGEIGSAVAVAGSLAGAGPLQDRGGFGGDTSTAGVRQIRHAVLSGTWTMGRLELSGRVIARSKMAVGDGRGWEAGAAVSPVPGVRLRLTGGRIPLASSLYLPFRHELSLGVELLPRSLRARRGAAGAAAFDARPDGGGMIAVTVRALANRVEIAGDFTGWEPVALAPDGAVWRGVIAAAPGLHQVNVRFDGGPWQVPPGLGSADDGFGGRVGVFVIR